MDRTRDSHSRKWGSIPHIRTNYCTYLTIYRGKRLPPFYIGYSSVGKVEDGYHGSVQSKRYKQTWKQELIENPKAFETIILSVHSSKEEANAREIELQFKLQVHKNPLYINQVIGRKFFAETKGFLGRKHTAETKAKIAISSTGRKGVGPKNYHHTEDAKARITAAAKLPRKPRSEDTKKKLAAATAAYHARRRAMI